MTSESLWDYYRDEIDVVDDNVTDGKSFEYKKIVEKHLKNLEMKEMQIDHQYQI